MDLYGHDFRSRLIAETRMQFYAASMFEIRELPELNPWRLLKPSAEPIRSLGPLTRVLTAWIGYLWRRRRGKLRLEQRRVPRRNTMATITGVTS